MQMLAAQYNDTFGVGTCTVACSLHLHILSEQVLTTISILIVHKFQSLDRDHKSQLSGMEMLAAHYNDEFGVGTCTVISRLCSHISNEQVLTTISILIVHKFQSLDRDHKSQLSGMEMLAAHYNDEFGVGTCTVISRLCSHISNEQVLTTISILIVH